MSSELMVKLQEYRENLKEELKNSKEKRQIIIDKVKNGEKLTYEENKANTKLAERIKEIEEKLDKFKNLDLYDNISAALEKLGASKTTKEEKEKLTAYLIKNFKKINKRNFEKLVDSLGIEPKEAKDINKLKEDFEEQLRDFEDELEKTKKRGNNTSDIEKDIKNTKADLKAIESYIKSYVSEEELKEDLKKLSNSKTRRADKDAILQKYNDIIVKDEENIISELEKEIELDNNKINTKEELNKISEFFKRHWKKIAAISGTVVFLVTILVIAKGCDKEIENTNLDNTKDPNGIVQTNNDNEILQALTNKGYNEYIAKIMMSNFSQDVIDKLIADETPYIASVENYAKVKEFKLEYLEDYEDARIKYNITAKDTVDYVNRSYLIQATRFYDEASINQIVEVVMSLDNKDLFTQDNANLAQSFNTSFNRIVDNYLFGTVTEADINKIDALQHFAKEGTDMDKFLTRFGSLTKNILTNPKDNATKEPMYNFINIFATSLNGFTNEPSLLTADEEFNKDAQLNDYYDWYMAYNSFIAPLYPINFPTYPDAPAAVPNIPEGATDDEKTAAWLELEAKWQNVAKENREITLRINDLENLQNLMLTALEGPEFEMICGQGRKLEGGN